MGKRSDKAGNSRTIEKEQAARFNKIARIALMEFFSFVGMFVGGLVIAALIGLIIAAGANPLGAVPTYLFIGLLVAATIAGGGYGYFFPEVNKFFADVKNYFTNVFADIKKYFTNTNNKETVLDNSHKNDSKLVRTNAKNDNLAAAVEVPHHPSPLAAPAKNGRKEQGTQVELGSETLRVRAAQKS